MNLPIGSPGLGAQGTDVKKKFARVDFLGSTLMVLAVGCIMLAAALGGQEIPYKSGPFAALLASFVVFLSSFVYVELHVSPEPTIPVRFLADRTVLCSSLANWFYSMGIYVVFYYVPIFFSSVIGLNPTQNGMRSISNFFGGASGSIITGVYMQKTGKYWSFSAIIGFLSVIGVFFITQTPSFICSQAVPCNCLTFLRLFLNFDCHLACIDFCSSSHSPSCHYLHPVRF
ncbi:hypothetical protein BABINDRAFT_126178 [Babjeviella inositovora NRRL Y-12698]|uniref:Major facilitator superfamily (MFS) profile domain-containing protein n=1 Tax=Babjeviella inositovora NRRL Y-12698 TaxID=984486 RepID=A0A1E3QSM6_9ASCO|nr:uncharacterized protein BABINDRAFT_126178 [Babjeviella inositovora NRRL Y-12698]ODQ80699.1 hypothetical protein BABINDRAFT_126178 [Babjeviella inositovora NRRL Y-12698]